MQKFSDDLVVNDYRIPNHVMGIVANQNRLVGIVRVLLVFCNIKQHYAMYEKSLLKDHSKQRNGSVDRQLQIMGTIKIFSYETKNGRVYCGQQWYIQWGHFQWDLWNSEYLKHTSNGLLRCSIYAFQRNRVNLLCSITLYRRISFLPPTQSFLWYTILLYSMHNFFNRFTSNTYCDVNNDSLTNVLNIPQTYEGKYNSLFDSTLFCFTVCIIFSIVSFLC